MIIITPTNIIAKFDQIWCCVVAEWRRDVQLTTEWAAEAGGRVESAVSRDAAERTPRAAAAERAVGAAESADAGGRGPGSPAERPTGRRDRSPPWGPGPDLLNTFIVCQCL